MLRHVMVLVDRTNISPSDQLLSMLERLHLQSYRQCVAAHSWNSAWNYNYWYYFSQPWYKLVLKSPTAKTLTKRKLKVARFPFNFTDNCQFIYSLKVWMEGGTFRHVCSIRVDEMRSENCHWSVPCRAWATGVFTGKCIQNFDYTFLRCIIECTMQMKLQLHPAIYPPNWSY